MSNLFFSILCSVLLSSCFGLPADWFTCSNSTIYGTLCMYDEPDLTQQMPINLTIAFYGDQGLEFPYNGSLTNLMRILKEEDHVEAIFHAGDFDYTNNPTAWDAMITNALGEDFPYFGVIGNHDQVGWTTTTSFGSGYNTFILRRWQKINNVRCWGDVGRNAVCSYKGLVFVVSSVGVDIGGVAYGTDFIDKAFLNYGSIWRVCMWHKNQHSLQLGDKGDEVGFEAYNVCRKKGAIIINGHEHSYCRSKTITNFDNVPTFTNEDPLVTGLNKTFVAVVGTAGMRVLW